MLIPHDDLKYARTQSALALAKVRHVGEAVAFVVADSRYIAEDAVDLIEVIYEALPAVADLDNAAVATSQVRHKGSHLDSRVTDGFARCCVPMFILMRYSVCDILN